VLAIQYAKQATSKKQTLARHTVEDCNHFHGFSQSFQANAEVEGLPLLGDYRFLPSLFRFIVYQ
jgi:hypothetical protein